jgi:hypothetical protein
VIEIVLHEEIEDELGLHERTIARIANGEVDISHQRKENCWEEWRSWQSMGATITFAQLKVITDLMEAVQKNEET